MSDAHGDTFKEDFFERVTNVQWEQEPEVLWMAGTGFPIIVNDFLGNMHAWIFTSENGHNWTGIDCGIDTEYDPGPGANQSNKPRGYSAFYVGAWMRRGLAPGAPQSWVMAGCDGKFVIGSAAMGSLDGVSLDPDGMVYWDDRHIGEQLFVQGKQLVALSDKYRIQGNFVVLDHSDPFFTADGIHWQPSNYHERTLDIGGLSAPLYVPSDRTVSVRSSKVLIVQTEQERDAAMRKLYLPVDKSLAVPQPLAAPQPTKEDKIVYIQSSYAAVGRLRRGPFSGKQVYATLAPFDPTPPAHGDGTVTVVDAKTGKTLIQSKCGVARTICLGYGHYTFCVGGSNGGGTTPGEQTSTIAYTDDLVNWSVIELGGHSQVNVFAVGPKKGAQPPPSTTPSPPEPTDGNGATGPNGGGEA